MNALPAIPIGASLVGTLGNRTGAEPRFLWWLKFLPQAIVQYLPYLDLLLMPYQKAFDRLLPMTGVSGVTISAVFALLQSAAHGHRVAPSTVVEFLERDCGDLGFRELDQQGRLQRAKKQAFTQRILMGLFGGIALIAPVFIMVLHPFRNVELITVPVAMIIFALLLAIGASDSTGKDVLAATAAYAAVLVVFIGTSGSSS